MYSNELITITLVEFDYYQINIINKINSNSYAESLKLINLNVKVFHFISFLYSHYHEISFENY